MTPDLELDSTPVPSVTRTSEHLTALFADAFTRLGEGEQVTFEVIVQALPDPTEANAWNPMVIVYAEIPAVTPREDHMATSGRPLQLNGWTQADADEIASKLLAVLAQARVEEFERLTQHVEPQANLD